MKGGALTNDSPLWRYGLDGTDQSEPRQTTPMNTVWHDFFANLAVLALFVAGWTHAQFWLEYRSPLGRKVIFGLIMGAGAVATMLMTVEFKPGVFFDMRSSLLASAGLFGGPIAAAISIAIAGAYRLWLGGAGVVPGISTLVISAIIGTGLGFACRGVVRWWHLIALAGLVATVNLGAILSLPAPMAADVL